MRRQTRNRMLWGAAFLLLVAAFIGVGFIPYSPDVTRQRVEYDMTRDFANQYTLTRATEGKPVTDVRDSVSCDKGGPKVADRGPGKDWICTVHYTASDVPAGGRIQYQLFVHGEACYTATDPKLIENASITDKSGASVPNPLEQFDGCFSVYDNRTSVTS